METDLICKRKPRALPRGCLMIFLMVIVACLGSFFMVWGFGSAQYEISGLQIELSVEPSSRGLTEVSLPPLGAIAANTHLLPLTIQATLLQINLDSLEIIAYTPIDQKEFLENVEKQTVQALKDFIRRLLLLSAIGGALGAFLVYPRNPMSIIKGLAIGLFLMVLTIGFLFLDFEPDAFRQPRFTGTLKAAPVLISSLEKGFGSVELFRKEMQNTASNLYNFYSKIEDWEPLMLEKEAIKLLHISDIHNNPITFDLIGKVIKDFKINFVVDTGDVTDFGSPIETEMASRIEGLDVPYLYTAGNHDSPASIERLQEMSNVKVLDGNGEAVEGINIVGFADPASCSIKIEPLSDEEMEKTSFGVADGVKSLKREPFIVALHDERMSEQIIGEVPVILFGHTHKSGIKRKGGSVLINAGTTGAAGLRAFEAEEGIPYTFHVLYIQKDPIRLIAIDSVEVMGLDREFVLKRTLIEKTEEKAATGTR
ncbi:MAG TPA: metallophosphoesterase [Actinobacteria bacterium]|nr:metallophosphoesterase [Actinomycetota bacterium]